MSRVNFGSGSYFSFQYSKFLLHQVTPIKKNNDRFFSLTLSDNTSYASYASYAKQKISNFFLLYVKICVQSVRKHLLKQMFVRAFFFDISILFVFCVQSVQSVRNYSNERGFVRKIKSLYAKIRTQTKILRAADLNQRLYYNK